MQFPTPAALSNNRLRDFILAGIALFLLVHHGLPALRTLAQEGSASQPREALSTAFTYQGRLEQSGTPGDGTFDFEFALFDNPTVGQGAPLGQGLLTVADQPVSNGLFSAPLDFGTGLFMGEKRWLEVSVREGGSTGAYETLGRQELTATPYALYSSSAPWSGISGIPLSLADGIDNDTTYTPGNGLTLNGTQFAVDFGGDGAANTVARSDHDHFGQSWSGTVTGSNSGLTVSGSGASGYIAYGGKIGVLGSVGAGICSTESLSNISAGMYGGTCVSSAASDGVRGYSFQGAGVRGESIAGGGGGSIGVLGIAGANPPVRPVNTGVYAYASAQDATGVYGRADGLNAVAVKGVAPSAQEYAGRFFGKVEVNGAFTNPSDIRLKHDILPLPYGLDAVAALNPVSYVMNDDTSSSTRFGLIAQDVRSVIPEVVHGDGEQEMLSLNYLDLIPVLIRGIQEQQAQIDSLTARSVAGGPPGDPASGALASSAPRSADGVALAFGLPVVMFGGLALVRRRRHAGFTLVS